MPRTTLAVAAAAALFLGAPAPGRAETIVEDGGMLLLLPPAPGEVPPDPFEVEVRPTAEEELRNVWSPAYAIVGDLRLDGMAFERGGSVGIRVVVEGQRLGFDGGFSGVFVRTQGGAALGAHGLLDAQLTFAPVSGPRGRLRLELGLGAMFSSCLSAGGPGLGASGELRLFGPVGAAGAVRAVFWPYRSVDWHAAVQLSLREYQVRVGVRHVSLDDGGLVDGQHHTLSVLGPWIGVGLRL